MKSIIFIRDTDVSIVKSLDEPPYDDTYKKDDTEHVDILDDIGDFVYVQFENGEVGFIPKKSFITIDQCSEVK